jgi:hypothetical protein
MREMFLGKEYGLREEDRGRWFMNEKFYHLKHTDFLDSFY